MKPTPLIFNGLPKECPENSLQPRRRSIKFQFLIVYCKKEAYLLLRNKKNLINDTNELFGVMKNYNFNKLKVAGGGTANFVFYKKPINEFYGSIKQVSKSKTFGYCSPQDFYNVFKNLWPGFRIKISTIHPNFEKGSTTITKISKKEVKKLKN